MLEVITTAEVIATKTSADQERYAQSADACKDEKSACVAYASAILDNRTRRSFLFRTADPRRCRSSAEHCGPGRAWQLGAARCCHWTAVRRAARLCAAAAVAEHPLPSVHRSRRRTRGDLAGSTG